MYANEDFLANLIVPILGSLLWLLLSWSLFRTLYREKAVTLVRKKMLSHGFLFVLGLAYFIAWNDQLAGFMRFPGYEVWRPLSFAWAVLLFYDAARRIQVERESSNASLLAGDSFKGDTPKLRGDWQNVAISILRFFLFFAVIGAIGKPGFPSFGVISALGAAIYLLSRTQKLPSHAAPRNM